MNLQALGGGLFKATPRNFSHDIPPRPGLLSQSAWLRKYCLTPFPPNLFVSTHWMAGSVPCLAWPWLIESGEVDGILTVKDACSHR